MRSFVLFLAAGVLATACSSAPDPEPTPTPTPTPTASPSPSPTPTPADAFPLTGEETDDPHLDRPVMSVKIDNAPQAQPHAGLEEADLVYEQLVEGGITRFAALFHSNVPSEIGPVRSGRLVDVPILEPWSSVLVYSGARPEVTSALQAAEQIGLLADSGPPTFLRAADRSGSHDLMVDADLALERAFGLDEAEPVPDDLPFAFEEDAPGGGTDQGEFSLRMSSATTVGWEWDEEADVFRRSRNGTPSRVTGEGRIGAANVIAIATDVGTGGCCDSAGNPYVVTRLQGSGDAVVWRDGQRFEATWEKEADAAHLQVLDADGDPFPFAPGPTWYHLAGASAIPDAPSTSGTED